MSKDRITNFLWTDGSPESGNAREILDKKDFPYKPFDVGEFKVADLEEPPVLITPHGVYQGVAAIEAYSNIPSSVFLNLRD